MVSPQYHIRYDDLFETVTQISIKSALQRICHFSSEPTRPWHVFSKAPPIPSTLSAKATEEDEPNIPPEEYLLVPAAANTPPEDPIPPNPTDPPNDDEQQDVAHSQNDDVPPVVPTGCTRPPVNVPPITPPPATTRSGRTTRQTQRFAESQAQRQQGLRLSMQKCILKRTRCETWKIRSPTY